MDYINLTYALLVSLFAGYVSFRARRLCKLSSHLGLCLFSQAFFAAAIAFFLQFVIELFMPAPLPVQFVFYGLFVYAMTFSGLSLVYSLVWKHHNITKTALLHLTAIVVAVIDMALGKGAFSPLFIVQISLLSYGAYVAYMKYKMKRSMQLYFIALVLMLIGWVFNYANILLDSTVFDLYTKVITAAIFAIFIYILHRKNG